MYPLIFLKDFYKVGHVEQYPKGTELIFSNFTPRKPINNTFKDGCVFFGLKYFIEKYLKDNFNKKNFLDISYQEFMKQTLNVDKAYSHIEDLLKLDKLPLEIYALPEGTLVPFGVPTLVMYNTDPKYYWLTNMLETILSCSLWGPCTSATIARQYRNLLDSYCAETSDNAWFVDYQAHDFSFRGMNGLEAAALSGAAHLLYFKGTDTIPGILLQHEIYGKELSCGTSVPATEHSVMSVGSKESELETYRRLITEVYPSGIVSIVSDTWDLWNVLDNHLITLKDEIMTRDGKVVIRPDSGDPVEIICGTETNKGVIQRLWDVFGGTINSKGYKELDPHIGCIYGDSITLERANRILFRLKEQGFSSTNIVFGVGSFTYQYNTRDTLGFAMKATYCEINGVGHAITKDPVTDNGTKKSHSGILKVVKVVGAHGYTYAVKQNCTWEEFHQEDNELKRVF